MSEHSPANHSDLAALKLRDGVAADVPALILMLADDQLGVLREDTSDEGRERYERAMAEIIAQGGNRILVAELNGKVVGFLQLTLIPGLARRGARRAQIESVRISSQMRSHGLGEIMMREAIAIAEREGCRLVQLATDRTRTDAHRFYQRLGFEVTHMGLKLELNGEERAQGPGKRA